MRSSALFTLLAALTVACSAPSLGSDGGPDGAAEGGTADAASDAPAPDTSPMWGLPERVPNTTCRLLNAEGMPSPTLSGTRCYADLRTQRPAPGLVPYEVIAPLWSDGTLKRRYIALPDGSAMTFQREGAWSFPEGTLLIKEFAIETTRGDPSTRRPIETRFLLRRGDAWRGFTYQWNDSSDEAMLLDAAGATRSYAITDPANPGTPVQYTHVFPSRSQCNACHTIDAGGALGLQTGQLNRDFTYPNGVRGNQLATLEHAGYFDAPLPALPSELPRWSDPADQDAPLVARARSYLAANCAHCHRPGGVHTGSGVDLRYEVDFATSHMCGPDSTVVVPGMPEASEMVRRMTLRGMQQMPPIATTIVDPTGTDVIRRWIASLTPADCGM